MIKIAKKNFLKKNLYFENLDIFNFSTKKKFDCISANGFIEYLSLSDIKKFIRISNDLLTNKGCLIFGTRNRLFNLYFLNKFSKNEIMKKIF